MPGWFTCGLTCVLTTYVKEQRVDSSYNIKQNLVFLRYTFIGFERNSLIRILSNQNINKRFLFYKMLQQRKYTLITTQSNLKSSMNP